jgi:hypothetical protein
LAADRDVRTHAQRMSDAAWQRRLENEFHPDTSFEDAARHFHRKDMKQGAASYEATRAKPAGRAHTTDAHAQLFDVVDDGSFIDEARRIGKQMREKKY